MKLFSCDGCGVVLDADKVDFSGEGRKYTDEGQVDFDRFVWDGEDYVAFISCPVCEEQLTKPE